MIALVGTVSGVEALAGNLARANTAAVGAVGVGVGRAMLGGQSIVRGRASGRPGPRNVTGDYRRTIVGDWEIAGDHVLGQVGTNAAQGRRLENGFVGPDALGRNYNQPPFPHFGPSVPEVQALVLSEVGGTLKAALG